MFQVGRYLSVDTIAPVWNGMPMVDLRSIFLPAQVLPLRVVDRLAECRNWVMSARRNREDTSSILHFYCGVICAERRLRGDMLRAQVFEAIRAQSHPDVRRCDKAKPIVLVCRTAGLPQASPIETRAQGVASTGA